MVALWFFFNWGALESMMEPSRMPQPSHRRWSNCQAIAQESYFVYATSAGAWESRENSGVGLPFGKLTQLLKIAIYSWFTH